MRFPILGEQIFNCYTDMLDPVQVKSAKRKRYFSELSLVKRQATLCQKSKKTKKMNTFIFELMQKKLISIKVRAAALSEGKNMQCRFVFIF